MKAPAQYDEWCAVFDAFGTPEHDTDVLAAVRCGVYPATAGKTERTTRRLEEAYERRLLALRSSLTNEMQWIGDGFELERALARLVTGLRPLAEMSAVGTLPENVRTYLHEKLDTFVAKIREALIDSVLRDRLSNGELVSSIRRVDLTIPWHEIGPSRVRGTQRVLASETPVFGKAPVRRILL